MATASAPDSFVTAIVIGTALAALAAGARWLWAHLVGLVAVTLVAFIAGGAIVGARASTEIEARAAVTIEPGGVMMLVAFGLAAVALLTQLQVLRVISRPPPVDGGPPAKKSPGIAIRANAALGVGLLSLVVPLAASLAIALGTLANGDIRRSQNQLEGLGRSLAGIVLGCLVLVLVLAAGIVGAIVARPGE